MISTILHILFSVKIDWATHLIGHELTAAYNLAHGITVEIVLPALFKVNKEDKLD